MSSGKQPDVMSEINEKLGGILGFLAVRDLKGDVSQMLPRLKGMGLSSKMIALITGISENAVAIRVSRMKTAGAKKSAKARKKAPAAKPTAAAESSNDTTDNAADSAPPAE